MDIFQEKIARNTENQAVQIPNPEQEDLKSKLLKIFELDDESVGGNHDQYMLDVKNKGETTDASVSQRKRLFSPNTSKAHKYFGNISSRSKKKKNLYWKRNIYPIVTFQDRMNMIRNERYLKAKHSDQVDVLSGIWIPELMESEFRITGLTHDISTRPNEFQHESPLNPQIWELLQRSKQKVNAWLEKYFEFF